jgi:hypothetical protein
MEETLNIDFISPTNTGFYLLDVNFFFRRLTGVEGAVHLVNRSMEI